MATPHLPPIRCYRCDGTGCLWDHTDDVEFLTPCPCVSAELRTAGDEFAADEAFRSTVVDGTRAPRAAEMTPVRAAELAAKTDPETTRG